MAIVSRAISSMVGGAEPPEKPIPPVVERNHMMRACQAFDNPWVEIVRHGAPVVQKQQRHAAAPTKLAIDETGFSNRDRQVGGVDVAGR